MFFDNWFELLRIFVVGVLAYCTLIVLLRLSGKRTLSKMNAFDLVVTMALGSTLATILLNKDIVLAEGIVAFLTLIALQFVVAWCNVRFRWFESLVNSEPTLLFYKGKFMRSAMQSERVTQEEIETAIRQQGVATMGGVEAVVLETDSSFSVVKSRESAGQADDLDDSTTLRSVKLPKLASPTLTR